MSDQPLIFDRSLLQQRRRRALLADSVGDVDFLLRDVIDALADRLSFIKREFDLALNYGCHSLAISNQLEGLDQIGHLISSDACPLDCGAAPFFVQADEEYFPFQSASFDLILSALSLQWVNDLPGVLVQIRRGLKPDGVFLAVTLGSESLYELRHVMMLAEEELYGGVSLRVAPFADVRDFGDLLQRAGFALPVTDRLVRRVRYRTAYQLMMELKAMGAGNMLTQRSRKPVSRRFFMRVEELYQQHYGEADGRIPASFEYIYLLGWAPHHTQPKPLKPGSGRVSLTEVFKEK